MPASHRTVARSEPTRSGAFLGLDVMEVSVTIAVVPSDAAVPNHVDSLPLRSRDGAPVFPAIWAGRDPSGVF